MYKVFYIQNDKTPSPCVLLFFFSLCLRTDFDLILALRTVYRYTTQITRNNSVRKSKERVNHKKYR